MVTKSKKSEAINPNALLDKIKSLAVQAMFSDDQLLEDLVLKGGNAMALIHRLSSRASVDLDFSLEHDFSEGPEASFKRIEDVLKRTFRENGLEVFDVKMKQKPDGLTEDMADFWGGYGLEFKLISAALFAEHAADLQQLQRRAINVGQSTKFTIDISRFEYTKDKQEADFEGLRIYVYSPEMIVCEKLRAICQQMPEYGPYIKRDRAGSARARDFMDIHLLVETLKLDMRADKVATMLVEMFRLKRVPLELLALVPNYREFHRADFPSVLATVKPGVAVETFDHYFDYTLGLVDALKPVWHKEPPLLDVAGIRHGV